MIAPTAIIQGLGKTIGLEWQFVEGATGDYNSDFVKKGKKAVELLEAGFEFVFLHIKAVDDAGHDKSLDLKLKYLAKVDEMVAYLIAHLKQETLIALTGDHTTPWSYGDHTFEPVPFAFSRLSWIQEKRKGDVRGFNEVDCLEGSLGRFCGK